MSKERENFKLIGGEGYVKIRRTKNTWRFLFVSRGFSETGTTFPTKEDAYGASLACILKHYPERGKEIIRNIQLKRIFG